MPNFSPRFSQASTIGKECVCFNIRKTSRALTKVYEAHLHPLGLKATQFNLLNILSAVESFTVNELADFTVMDRTSLTRALKPLERDGLVAIQPGQDRRTRFISITSAGIDLLDRAIPLWKQAQSQIRDQISDQDWHDTQRVLFQMIGLATKSTDPLQKVLSRSAASNDE